MIFIENQRNDRLRKGILERFISGVMTDDERAQMMGLPVGCRMRENAKIISPENFTCGEQVWIGEGAVLDASGGLTVGSHTSIGLGVYIWTHTSFLTNLTFNNTPGNPLIERSPTRIGRGCFISGPSVIFPGVTIGDQVMVLPMSVVNKDVPSRSMVGGNPARLIKHITDEFIAAEIARVQAGGATGA